MVKPLLPVGISAKQLRLCAGPACEIHKVVGRAQHDDGCPLTVTSIMRYGTTTFRGKRVVTNTGEGVRRQTWGERPFAAVVVRDGAEVSAEHLRVHLAASVPRWQLPERWAYIDEVPKTSVGKFSKRMMREAYAHGEYKVIQVG